MDFSVQIVAMLGEQRVTDLTLRLDRMEAHIARAPDRASWIRHLKIPLAGGDAVSAQNNLISTLRGSGPNWFFATAVATDGTHFGYASNIFLPQPSNLLDSLGQLLLFDVYTSFGGWWVSHVWRATDLVRAAISCLESWQVIPGAACARSLVEGIAAFTVEGEEMLKKWSEFKALGPPDLDAVKAFQILFSAKLNQAQFGTRVGELASNSAANLKRTHINDLLREFSKRVGGNILTNYEWLCDAVHPSFGSQTAYVVTQGVHSTGATFAADLAHRPDLAQSKSPKIEPTVAWATVDTLIDSIDTFLEEAPRLRWLIDDLGLTTGVAFISNEAFIGRQAPFAENDICPCGRGIPASECQHKWGRVAVPGQSNISS